MAKTDPIVLGIDLQPGEVRIAEVALRGGRPTLLKTGSAPLPDTAVHMGVVAEPGTVAGVIRGLIESMGTKPGLRGVYGVPAEACVLATMVIPPAPESELGHMVAGEIAHYGFLRSPGAQHNYLKLHRIGRQNDEGGTPVAVVGAEEHVIAAIRTTAEMAGVAIAAIEPSSWALLRTSALAVGNSAAFHLVLTATHAETAFVNGGDLASYRRLDMGGGGLREDSVATEVRRSIEFLWRENAETAPLDTVHLAPVGEISPAYVEGLQAKIGLPVRLVVTPGSDDVRYAAAFGLAARGTSGTGTVPKVDLFAGERAAVQTNEKRRNLAGSLAITAIALVFGVLGFTLFSRAADATELDVAANNRRAAALRAEADALVDGRRKQLAQYEALRKEGAPVDALLDTLGDALLPGVGLKAFRIEKGMNVVISGEARSEKLMLETLDRLRTSKLLTGLTVRSFERPAKIDGLTFEVGGSTLASDRVRYPHEKEEVVKAGDGTNPAATGMEVARK